MRGRKIIDSKLWSYFIFLPLIFLSSSDTATTHYSRSRRMRAQSGLSRSLASEKCGRASTLRASALNSPDEPSCRFELAQAPRKRGAAGNGEHEDRHVARS